MKHLNLLVYPGLILVLLGIYVTDVTLVCAGMFITVVGPCAAWIDAYLQRSQ